MLYGTFVYYVPLYYYWLLQIQQEWLRGQKSQKFGMLETKNLIYLIQCSKCQEMPVHRFAERPNANLVNDLDNTADPSWTGNINSVIPLLSPHILTKLDIHSTTSF